MRCKTVFRVDAFNLFDEMPHRNLATWNAYLSFAVQDQRSVDAIAAFKEFLCARRAELDYILCVSECLLCAWRAEFDYVLCVSECLLCAWRAEFNYVLCVSECLC
jgi:hypothetical protein